MTTSMLAFGKASASGHFKPAAASAIRHYASNAAAAPMPPPGPNGTVRAARTQDDPVAQRELFMDILSVNATKRDARPYLTRFRDATRGSRPIPSAPDSQTEHNARRLEQGGVNLGSLYAPSRAIAQSPQFKQQDVQPEASADLHLALICLRAPQNLDDSSLDGLATTLAQLGRLDMRVILVLELDEFASTFEHENVRLRRAAFAEQAERLSQAIGRHTPDGSRFVTGALEMAGPARDFGEGTVTIPTPKLILNPLQRGMMPIVPCLAYTPTGILVEARVTDVMAALTEQFSGLTPSTGPPLDKTVQTSLDRIIVLDPAGGIPSRVRGDHAHVFVNLEQEFDDILAELSGYAGSCRGTPRVYEQHQENLRMLRRCLGMLPSASSALIIAPAEAARSAQGSSGAHEPTTIGAGTRRQKNTLIHNLLTNKPLVSSSLPPARMPLVPGDAAVNEESKTATLVKRGMPLTIIPAADRTLGWKAPATGRTAFTLDHDARVDVARLVHLIEDSFRRKLDVAHYLGRIAGRTAGLIVAGEYEGGAILTWEQPQGTSDPQRLVPYLDKFAVLQSSQGSAGVADIVFQAMVRSCFPDGVCWRSRQDNPVNKWYFERATGSWQIPGTNWTMFWTGDGVVEDPEKFHDYVAVCREVAPSWADGKKPD